MGTLAARAFIPANIGQHSAVFYMPVLQCQASHRPHRLPQPPGLPCLHSSHPPSLWPGYCLHYDVCSSSKQRKSVYYSARRVHSQEGSGVHGRRLGDVAYPQLFRLHLLQGGLGQDVPQGALQRRHARPRPSARRAL